LNRQEHLHLFLKEINLEKGILAILVVVFLVGALLNPRFLTSRNIMRMLSDASAYIPMAIGMTFVIVSGGIDLSVGSVLAITSSLFGYLVVVGGWNVLSALTLVLLFGAFIGFLNGILITKLFLPPFITTLGTLSIFRGLAWLIFEGQVFFAFPEPIQLVGWGRLLGIPVIIIIALVIIIGAWLVFQKMRYGRYLQAIGGNSQAALLFGIPVERVLISSYTLMGFLTAVSGFLILARTDAVQATVGVGMEFFIIAAVVLGGTSLIGGKGSVLSSVLGMIILTSVPNMMILGGISFKAEQIIVGGLILFALLIYSNKVKYLMDRMLQKKKVGVGSDKIAK